MRKTQRRNPTTRKREKMFNGKPMSYWKQQAKEIVVRELLAAASLDVNSLPCKLAHKRLMALAMAEDAALVEKIQKEREQWQINAGRALAAMTQSRRENEKS